MGIVTKRSSMTFFSDGQSHYSHRVRIVLAEKGVAVDIIDVDPDDRPAELSDHNPYNDLPTLLTLDRLAFSHIWHKSFGNLSEALAKAASFAVALVDEQIVAYEWCEIYKEHAHLTRLAVHPDYQGHGIGAQLLYQAIIDALDEGADLITLNTQEENHRSRALYERFGFVDTKQRMPVLWKDLG